MYVLDVWKAVVFAKENDYETDVILEQGNMGIVVLDFSHSLLANVLIAHLQLKVCSVMNVI